MEGKELKIRLQSCLETILETKDSLDSIPFGASFLPELGSLETFLSRLTDMEPTEAEVKRVEEATARFLGELAELMAHAAARKRGNDGVLQ